MVLFSPPQMNLVGKIMKKHVFPFRFDSALEVLGSSELSQCVQIGQFL